MTTAISIEDLSKQYRLGQVGTGTISHDLNRWWARVRGKEDPYSKVGQVNKRDQAADGEYVWALQNINLSVEQGEVVGIIGSNGAGKSTLLKLISRITSPTTGTIKAKGRIACLLEVGTGMHPEMTARENIYMNGAVLGMRRHEITRKLDDIVDFAGCRMFVDTPVKRFSSGMKVRVGFAVAAFLEPEILIVDEVLAVGDAEFQRRAIGKMKEVSTTGDRTVLFVSHNMASIRKLCPRSIHLDAGTVKRTGPSDEIISAYINDGLTNELDTPIAKDSPRTGSGRAMFTRVWIENEDGNKLTHVTSGANFTIAIEVTAHEPIPDIVLSIALQDSSDSYAWLVRSNFDGAILGLNQKTILRCTVEDFNLARGAFRGVLFMSERDNEILDSLPNAFTLDVAVGDYFGTGARGLPNHCKTLTRATWKSSSQA
ncbi:MAG TPA: ABC transporter ATP-binding protein [Planctomycetaceae bacterium]|nr:ABC transporter ATP-binding protein [Planctomycetaceae bacterium]